MTTIGELFAGIGGFSLAFHAAGARTAWFVEKEPFCQKVLQKNFPGVPIHGDIYECHDLPYVDCICAGFPCQPFSSSGRRRGENDERYLIPEMFRVIEEVRPRVVLFENVVGFTNITDGHTFREFLRALAQIGYDASWANIRASDIGAPHRRERWLCVAYADGATSGGNGRAVVEATGDTGQSHVRPFVGRQGQDGNRNELGHTETPRLPYRQQARQSANCPQSYSGVGRNRPERSGNMGYTEPRRRSRVAWGRTIPQPENGYARHGWAAQRGLGRSSDGLPARLDEHRWPARPGQPQFAGEPPRVVSGQPNRAARLKALGNSVVPQCVYPIACEIVTWLEAQASEEGQVA